MDSPVINTIFNITIFNIIFISLMAKNPDSSILFRRYGSSYRKKIHEAFIDQDFRASIAGREKGKPLNIIKSVSIQFFFP